MFRRKQSFSIGARTFLFAQWVLFANPSVEARPVEANRFESEDGSAVWYRLENREVRLDFSAENSFRIDSVRMTQGDTELAALVEETRSFWEDRIDGEKVLATSAKLLPPKEPDETAALEVTGNPAGTDAGRIRFGKTVRLFSEGAQFEVQYEVENLSSESLPAAYSIRLPWNVASRSNDASYYLPSSGSIRKIAVGEISAPVQVEGLEIPEPWFGMTSLKDDLSCLFASDRPLVAWNGNRAANGGSTVEAVVWEGTLKPGEKQEGTCWVAAVPGLGEPVSVTGRYAVGAAWNPGYRFDTYCLETRFVGMPQGLREFRTFSGVRRNSSSVAMVPVYTRRSKLSPTAVYSVPMPGSYEEGTHYLEQSIYSSSENLGYWNVALSTPGKGSAQVPATPSGPMTSLSYFIPPEEGGQPEKAADYLSAFPHSEAETSEPEDPTGDEIALLEWPSWEREGPGELSSPAPKGE